MGACCSEKKMANVLPGNPYTKSHTQNPISIHILSHLSLFRTTLWKLGIWILLVALTWIFGIIGIHEDYRGGEYAFAALSVVLVSYPPLHTPARFSQATCFRRTNRTCIGLLLDFQGMFFLFVCFQGIVILIMEVFLNRKARVC